MISSRGLTTSDPLMEAAPYPAGFPLRQGGGAEFGEQQYGQTQGYSSARPVKSGLTGFNSNTMAAPYPTGFPLQNPRTSARGRSDHGVIKLERRYLK